MRMKVPLEMRPPDRRLWSRVPGYQSEDGDSDDDAKVAAKAKQQLKDVAQHLGDAWEELPVLEFNIAPQKVRRNFKDGRSEPYIRQSGSSFSGGFKIEHTDAPIVRDTLRSSGLCPTTNKDWLIQWSGPGMKDSTYQDEDLSYMCRQIFTCRVGESVQSALVRL
ncbi:unnamed protein product [Polarella glacialis]|uniref:Uncharacterized protein n=1 Tax=Polarella glacialis TaxID=89957 RepID=A0A813HYS6_POLGL|nr:unnamed protein product [Polarella glacialis]